MSTNDQILDHCAQIKLHADHIIALVNNSPVPPDPIPPDPIPPDPIPPGVKPMVMDWANPTRLYTRDVGGFYPGDIIAVAFTTGPNGTTNALPSITCGEYQDPPQARYAVISEHPGDFIPAGPYLFSGPSTSVTVTFGIQPGSGGFYGTLKANTTYYFNIRIEGGEPGRTYNAFIDLRKPGGL